MGSLAQTGKEFPNCIDLRSWPRTVSSTVGNSERFRELSVGCASDQVEESEREGNELAEQEAETRDADGT